jgi:hypothetical protein
MLEAAARAEARNRATAGGDVCGAINSESGGVLRTDERG